MKNIQSKPAALIPVALLVLSTIIYQPSTLCAQGTAFTYQGRLNANGSPASGSYDLSFSLYGTSSGGSQVTTGLTNPAVTVADGLFVTTLDFGAPLVGGVFQGADLWVEIGVRTNGSAGPFATLSTRQQLTPSPYAIYAAGAGLAIQVAAGSVHSYNLTPNAVTPPSIADGTVVRSLNGLTDSINLSAGANVSITPSNNTLQISANGGGSGGWAITGNGGTTVDNFLGTLNNQPLELRVNNARVLRLEPTGPGAPNVIGGAAANYVTPGYVGATIGGGGGVAGYGSFTNSATGGDFGTVAGGAGNTSHGNYATVGGGSGNTSSSYGATVGGGYGNTSGSRATVGGGSGNTSSGDLAFVGGGGGNSASTNDSTVAGGAGNTSSGLFSTVGGGLVNLSSGRSATVGGGFQNYASGAGAFVGGGGDDGGSQIGNTASGIASTVAGGLANSASNSYSTVGGGIKNTNSGSAATVGGGQQNVSSGNYATVGGGVQNTSGNYATVGGGGFNTSSGSAASVGGGQHNSAIGDLSTVPGGYQNSANGLYATIPGGWNNSAVGTGSFAAGVNAHANHNGSFVWGDGTGGAYSGGPNRFDVLASGGFGFFVGSAAGSGNVTIDSAGNLNVSGGANVCALTIRGGCDVAEPFQMSSAEIPQGAVVIIDEENPGRLKLSERAYDTQVAGIVSGLNGIRPGISLSQQGVLEGGQNVALSGRVYVLADASSGPIKPGDLLTTSSTPGHAMRVTDHGKAQGAILGKAMSALKDGKGMVLVLVTLQ